MRCDGRTAVNQAFEDFHRKLGSAHMPAWAQTLLFAEEEGISFFDFSIKKEKSKIALKIQ